MTKYKGIEGLWSYVYDKTNELYDRHRASIVPEEELTKLVMKCVQHSKKLRRAYDKAHTENFKYIPKSKLKLGGYYFGICRNGYFGFWDGHQFQYARTKFRDTYIDEIEHFEDVKNTGMDGFIPVKLITLPFKITNETDKKLEEIRQDIIYYEKPK